MGEKARNSWATFIINSEENEDFDKRAFTYWINPDTQQRLEKVAELFRQCSETEIPVEKTSQWTIKNQALTTKIKQDYVVHRRQEITDRKEYIKSLLKSDIYEPGTVTELQLFLEEKLADKKEQTQSILQQVYLEVFEYAEIFTNLLQVISQIDYKLIEPAGPIMALAATRHHSCEVRECGLRCYENWEDPQYLPLLKSLYFEEKWLQNYLELLISDFEEGE